MTATTQRWASCDPVERFGLAPAVEVGEDNEHADDDERYVADGDGVVPDPHAKSTNPATDFPLWPPFQAVSFLRCQV